MILCTSVSPRFIQYIVLLNGYIRCKYSDFLLILAYRCKFRLRRGDGGYGGFCRMQFLCGMKPIRSTIPVRELQTLLRQWRRKGLKETDLLKVLELYLGLPNYMNEHGEYPVHSCRELSVCLKFRTVYLMLEAVRRSGSFGWEPGENKANMSCFYSPLWKKVSGEEPAESPAELHANLQVGNNIYNINVSSI